MQGNHIWMIYLDSGSMIKLEIDTDKLYLLKLLFKCHTVKPKFKSSKISNTQHTKDVLAVYSTYESVDHFKLLISQLHINIS